MEEVGWAQGLQYLSFLRLRRGACAEEHVRSSRTSPETFTCGGGVTETSQKGMSPTDVHPGRERLAIGEELHDPIAHTGV